MCSNVKSCTSLSLLFVFLKVEKSCQNLTRDDAPLNGGLVCHFYHEENSQQCGVRCNDGYEFPSRVNDYEYCGPVTGYTWSFKREDPDALIPPCIGWYIGLLHAKDKIQH